MRSLLVLALISMGQLRADEMINCSAKVGLANRFTVALNRTTLLLTIDTLDGYHYQGYSTMRYSPKSGSQLYFLPLMSVGSGNAGLGVDVETGGMGRVVMCLTSTECYLCR